MKTERPYVRIYHDDLMRDYPHVWKDDPALAAFDRLLVVADKMWPTLPELPRAIRPRALAILTQVSETTGHALIELVQPHSFRIRGHNTERAKRQDAARNAAAMRWDSGRNADRNATGNAESMPRRDETKNENQGSTRPSSSNGARARGPVYPIGTKS